MKDESCILRIMVHKTIFFYLPQIKNALFRLCEWSFYSRLTVILSCTQSKLNLSSHMYRYSHPFFNLPSTDSVSWAKHWRFWRTNLLSCFHVMWKSGREYNSMNDIWEMASLGCPSFVSLLYRNRDVRCFDWTETNRRPTETVWYGAYFGNFFAKFRVFSGCFHFIMVCFEIFCFSCFASIPKQRVLMFRLNWNKQKTNRNSLIESIYCIGIFSYNFMLFRVVSVCFGLFRNSLFRLFRL